MSTTSVYGVKLCATDMSGPNKGCSNFVETTLPANHPIFEKAPTVISKVLGFPLVMWKLNTRMIGTTTPRTAWLMINDKTRLAPMEWQDNVGDVAVAKADKSPLSVKELMAFTDYVWEMLSTSDPFEEDSDEEYDPRMYYDPNELKAYMDIYPKSRDAEVNFPMVRITIAQRVGSS